MIRLLTGDAFDHLRAMPSESVDAVVTDPPYGLSAPPDVSKVLAAWMAGEQYEHTGAGFMGAAWDSFVPGPRVWREVLRVLKPGGHAVVFAGTRTVDLMGISVRLAGFEVRDTIHWSYWSGFPKSLDISADIDRMAGAEREVVGVYIDPDGITRTKRSDGIWSSEGAGSRAITAPATPDAIRWQGFGTGIKPSIEPALLLRKPIRESSIARQVLATGTGALNLDACRFKPGDPMWPGPDDGGNNLARVPAVVADTPTGFGKGQAMGGRGHDLGRFPANLVSVAKASRGERELGCAGLPLFNPLFNPTIEHHGEGAKTLTTPSSGAGRGGGQIRNGHPTVKPLKLMRWLVRLVGCQPGSVILDPFMGSGTTGMAAVGQGYSFIGCELLPEHMAISRARIEYAASGRGVECDLEDTRAPAAQADLFRGG